MSHFHLIPPPKVVRCGVADATRRHMELEGTMEHMRFHITFLHRPQGKGSFGIRGKQEGTEGKAGSRSGCSLTSFYRRWILVSKLRQSSQMLEIIALTQLCSLSAWWLYCMISPAPRLRGLEKHLWFLVTKLRLIRLFAHFMYLMLYQDRWKFTSTISLAKVWPPE